MALYRFAVTLLTVFVVGRALLRGRWGEAWRRLFVPGPKDRQPHVLLHAASNGELTSAKPVLDALAREGIAVVVSCNSTTGVALAWSWGLPAILSPVDLTWAMRRLARLWDIRAMVVMETELWPNRLDILPGPKLLLGARVSPKTGRGWEKYPEIANFALDRITAASPQDVESRKRLIAFGFPEERLWETANLKTLVTAESHTPLAPFDPDATWLAASTHEGEEKVVADAHLQLLNRDPALRLILAPRHPDRADGIEAMLRSKGLDVARRSRGEDVAGAQVYLADTLGEMSLWYASAGVVFVGGSLVDKGGHTPFEPAAYGRALIHGPNVGNFTDAYARLRVAGASREVADAAALAGAVRDTFPDHVELGGRARACLDRTDEANVIIGRTIAALRDLPPL